MIDQPEDAASVRFWSFDTPGGPVLLAECRMPDSSAERPDVPLGVMCQQHLRSWHWCLDLSTAWCDGGPPDYAWHIGSIVAEEAA